MKAIVYTSNAGHTKQYAGLLGKKIGLPVYELRDAAKELQRCVDIIYMGWLMAGKIKGYKKAAKFFKVRAVCGIGMAASGTQLDDMKKVNRLQSSLPVFFL